MTMTLISTVTVGAGGQAAIDFNSIAGTFTDLLLIHSLRINDASFGADSIIQFNGDTGANYSFRRLAGDGGTASSGAGSSNALYCLAGVATGTTADANTFGNASIYIPNYASSTQKSVSVDSVSERNGSTSAFQNIIADIWTGTAAITSIKLRAYSGANLLQYSTASLYGILKGSGGATVS